LICIKFVSKKLLDRLYEVEWFDIAPLDYKPKIIINNLN